MLNDAPHIQKAALPTIGPGAVVGRYVLADELDHGRFGTVYRAVDTQSGSGQEHCVALLVLPAEVLRGGQTLDAFEREIGRVQALRHPNIVKVLDFACDGGVHFIVMEYIDGESLRAIVDSLRPEVLWERDAVALVRAIGDALVYAHARGVVHGDVRLENVIVTAQHDVKVLFTSACLASSAPFVVEPRDDVHALACIAYELLSGQPPFTSHSATGPDGQPRRLKNLTRRQWKMFRAILIGRDDRMRSVSEFLEEFGAVSATRLDEEQREPEPRRMAWRWVTPAWILALLGAGYVLTSGTPDPPAGTADQPAVTPDPPAAAPDELAVGVAPADAVAAVKTSAPQPATETVATPFPKVDGRVTAPLDGAAARPDQRSMASRAQSASAGDSSAADLSIVTFAQSAFTAAESEGVVTLELRRSGALERPARVVWWISAGTARPDEDYASFGPVVEAFRAGEDVRRILIPIISDSVREGREEFRVHLRTVDDAGTQLGAITQVTVTLVDDDR